MAANLEQQLVQLDELLGLLDANALRSAQEGLEHQIAELSEQLEATRKSLAQAHAQRKRLARARLLLDDSVKDSNGNSDPALHHETPSEEPESTKAAVTFVAESRTHSERRTNGAERRQVEDRRSKG